MKILFLKTTEKLDLAKPLLAYCCANYGREACDMIRSYIENLNSLRNEISNFQDCCSSNEHLLDSLRSYLKLLTQVETKFVFSERKNCVQLRFKWTDSFNPNLKISMYNIQYEKACVIYNIGCIYCNIGIKANKSDSDNFKDNIKLSVKYFTMAVGVLVLLRDDIMNGISVNNDEIPSDLHPNSLNMNINMLLAQAQTCFYEKAVKDKMNRSLLSKLSYQISLFYNTALGFAKKMKNNLPPYIAAWFSAQELSYLAASNYQKALADKADVESRSEGYGALISRLRQARYYYQQASQILEQHNIHLNLSSLKSTIETELEMLEKDNANIYLEIIPEAALLPKLDAVVSVKPTHLNIQDLYNSSDVVIQAFNKLIPENMRHKVDEYSAMCESLLMDVEKCVNKCLSECRMFLSDNDLPFSVQQHTVGFPESLWSQIYKVQLEGGVESLESLVSQLTDLASKAEEKLCFLDEMIKAEQNEYNKNNELYANNMIWKEIASSDKLNIHLYSSLNNYKAKLQQAKSANITILEKLNRSKCHAHLLSLNRDSLEKFIPNEKTSFNDNNNNNNNNSNNLKSIILTNVKKLNELADALVHENEHFKNVVRKDNINAALMQARQSGRPYEQILEKEFTKFDEGRAKINEQIKQIKESIAQLSEIWINYKSTQKNTSNDRSVFFKELSSSCNLLLEGFRDASEGLRFFSLLNQYLRTLEQQINEWVSMRLDAMDAKKNFIKGLEKSAINSNSSYCYPTCHDVNLPSSASTFFSSSSSSSHSSYFHPYVQQPNFSTLLNSQTAAAPFNLNSFPNFSASSSSST